MTTDPESTPRDGSTKKASRPASEGGGWRLIESAPKDGTTCWLAWPGACVIGSWEDDGKGDHDWEWGYGRYQRGADYKGPPTCWQPYLVPMPPPLAAPTPPTDLGED